MESVLVYMCTYLRVCVVPNPLVADAIKHSVCKRADLGVCHMKTVAPISPEITVAKQLLWCSDSISGIGNKIFI